MWKVSIKPQVKLGTNLIQKLKLAFAEHLPTARQPALVSYEKPADTEKGSVAGKGKRSCEKRGYSDEPGRGTAEKESIHRHKGASPKDETISDATQGHMCGDMTLGKGHTRQQSQSTKGLVGDQRQQALHGSQAVPTRSHCLSDAPTVGATLSGLSSGILMYIQHIRSSRQRKFTCCFYYYY